MLFMYRGKNAPPPSMTAMVKKKSKLNSFKHQGLLDNIKNQKKGV